MPFTVITPPASEPLALGDAKAWLNIDHSFEDTLIEALIRAGRATVERATGLCLIARTVRETRTHWTDGAGVSRSGAVNLAAWPILNVDAVIVDGLLVPSTDFSLDRQARPAALTHQSHWPDAGLGVMIDYQAGYGVAATDLPPDLVLAVKLIVSRAYERRSGAETDPDKDDIARLIAPYRRVRA